MQLNAYRQIPTWIKLTTIAGLATGALVGGGSSLVQTVCAQGLEVYSCDADLNEDGIVDSADYSILIKDFFKDVPENDWSDINFDDIVDISDYAMMVVVFGQKCEDNDFDDFEEGDEEDWPDEGDIFGGVNVQGGTDGPQVRPTPSPLPSGVPTPIPSPTPQPSPIDPYVNADPSNKLQTLIDQYPAGTTFVLKPGLYRTRTLRLKPGTVIQGEKGTILSGARLLNPNLAQTEGAFFFFSNQTLNSPAYPAGFRGVVGANASVTGYACLPSAPMCNFNEELYINNRKLRRVQTKAQLAIGTWFYDSANARVYLGESPVGKTVELSMTPIAIQDTPEVNGGGKVTLKNLTIEKFATPAQSFAIDLTGPENLVAFSEIRGNHGGGVSVGPRSKIQHNYIHHNGQLGIGGDGAHDVIVERNLITRNNVDEFEPSWVAGGAWFTGSDRVIFRENYIRYNDGPGIAMESDSLATSITNNQLVENGTPGVQIGLSFDCVIQNNYFRGNGTAGTDHTQVLLRNSAGCKVLTNTVITHEDNTLLNGGINLQTGNNRGSSTRFPTRAYNTSNSQVVGNQLYFPVNPGYAVRVVSKETQAPSSFAAISPSITVDQNKYWMKNTGGKRWLWGSEDPITFTVFQSFNRDRQGSVSEFTAAPAKPAWKWAVGPQEVR